MARVQQIEAAIPEKLEFLFQPHRYKVAHGGRGGAKSWAFADALLIQGLQAPLRILCAREIQKSMRESVHQLLRDRIEALELESFYQPLNDEIRGKNGTLFLFAGLRHNIDNIKSKEGIDRVWVEEAQNVSKHSWETLIPTIRKEGSEIWISFNPELDTDETYKRFVLNPPKSAIVAKVNWSDNPWFPKVLRDEKDDLKRRDPVAYLTVWEGHCRQVLDGAIYAQEILKATEEGRITRVPYDETKPVHTFWDLGWADKTSIWFAQAVGFDYRIIDFHQANRTTIADFLKVLQGKGYVYGTDYLPHDADSGNIHSNGRGVDQMMRAAGRKVIITQRPSRKLQGIVAARSIFANCWFDQEKCADGLNALRRYRYEVDKETGQFSREPDHDENSHAADAFQTLAFSLKDMTKKPGVKPAARYAPAATGWMG
jgi:phage terminase large subunit